MKRIAMAGVAALILACLGLWYETLPNGQSFLPPCHTQYTQWHSSVYGEIQKLRKNPWEASMMLSPLYPPRCAIKTKHYRVLMWDLAHGNKLTVKEITLLHKLERK